MTSIPHQTSPSLLRILLWLALAIILGGLALVAEV
jgi:hypothetical protein